MGDVVTRLRGTTFSYKGQPVPQDVSYGSPLLASKNRVREYIGDHFESKDRPFGFEETVAAVVVEGDTAMLTFPKRKGTISGPANCGHDYSRPLGIDHFGNIDYPYGCSGTVVLATDVTYRQARIPAWQAAKITAGVKVAVNFPPGVTYFGSLTSNTDPVDAQIVWVKRGEDVIWVAGVGL